MNYLNSIIFTCAVIAMSSCNSKKEKEAEQNRYFDSLVAANTAETDSMIAAMEAENAAMDAKLKPGVWNYEELENKMADENTFVASINANDLLQFEFPYSGGSTATLYVRKKEGNTDVYVTVSKGQFKISSYDGMNVRVKFDDGQASSYSCSGASSGSSDIFFFDSEKTILQKIKSSKVMLVEAEFFDHGKETMQFNVEGLVWEH